MLWKFQSNIKLSIYLLFNIHIIQNFFNDLFRVVEHVRLHWDFFFFFCFSIWVFFHEHSRITGLQGKGEGISLTPHYHFHPLHRQLDISQAIAAESSPLHIASSRTQTGNLWFPSTSRWPLSYTPSFYYEQLRFSWQQVNIFYGRLRFSWWQFKILLWTVEVFMMTEGGFHDDRSRFFQYRLVTVVVWFRCCFQ